jgi:hypothetical protein
MVVWSSLSFVHRQPLQQRVQVYSWHLQRMLLAMQGCFSSTWRERLVAQPTSVFYEGRAARQLLVQPLNVQAKPSF